MRDEPGSSPETQLTRRPGRVPSEVARRPVDAAGVLCLYVILLTLLPARLVISAIPFNVTPAMLVGYLCLAWWFTARLVPAISPDRDFQPVRWALFLLWASLMAAYVAAYFKPIPSDVAHDADRSFITIIASFGVALVAADGIDSWKRLDRLLRLLAGCCTWVAILGIVQFKIGLDIGNIFQIPGLRPVLDIHYTLARGQFNRPFATATHPIEFGVVLATVMFLSLHYAFIAEGRRQKCWWWFSVIAIALGALMSLSRSAILGIAVAAPVVFFAWPRGRRVMALLLLPVFLASTRLVIPGLVGTLSSLFRNVGNDPSISGRTGDYAQAFHDWSTSRWFGHGFGTVDLLLDNQYLASLIETGVVGLSALLAMFVLAAFTARGARWRTADPAAKQLCQSLVAAMTVLFVSYVTFDAFAFPMCTGVTFLLVGCSGAAWRIALRDQRLAGSHPVSEGWAIR